MEDKSVSENANGKVSCEKHETTQFFLQIGHKVTKKETSLLYVNSQQKEVRQVDGADENDVNVENDNQLKEPITEADLVVVNKISSGQENHDDEPKEDENSTVENLLSKIESVTDHRSSERTEEPEYDKGEALEEDAPVVINKGPLSLHIEHAIDQDEGVKDEKNSDEKEVGDEQVNEERQTIVEDEHLVVEKTPAALESELLVEEESPGEDDNTTVESLLVNIESAIDHQEYSQKPVDENKPKALEEDAPVVINKGPLSFYIEHAIDQDEEGNKDEKNSDEKEVGDEQVNEERQTIVEDEHLVVEKTPAALESELLVEKESPEEDDNATVESLLVNIESAIDGQEFAQKPVDENKPEALEEDAPVVIYKGPLSLHIEHAIDLDEEGRDEQNSDQKEVGDVQVNEGRETIVEDEHLVVEKTPAALESELLVEKESSGEDGNATVESLLVNIESAIDHQEYTQKPVDENKPKALEEDAPVVIDRGPLSLYIEHAIDQDEVDKDERNSHQKEVADEKVNEERQTILEDEHLVVEKTPAALESELLVEKESPEEDDNATVESLLVNIESVIDHQKPAPKPVDENKPEALEEDSPVVIHKGPPSLHIEHIEQFPDQEEGEGQTNADELKFDVEEVEGELVAVKKTPTALETELLIEQEGPKDDDSTVESLLVNVESVIGDTLPVHSEQRDNAVEDTVQETLPPAVVRKPSETRHELLQTAVTCDNKPDDVSEEVESREIVKDDDKINGKEEERPKHIEVVTTEKEISTVTITTKQITQTIETSTEEAAGNPTPVVTVTSTEESFKSSSYTELVQRDDRGDESELLRPVLRKRLSEPEVLPEREKDGSAPLALSECELLDSKEHVMIEDVSQAKDSTPKSTEVKTEAVPAESEPYKDVPDEEKLITEGDVEVSEKAEGIDRNRAEDEQGLLDVEDEEKGDEKEAGKKEKKGLSSPQCKCCSLM